LASNLYTKSKTFKKLEDTLIYIFLLAIAAWVIYVLFENDSSNEVTSPKKNVPNSNNTPQVVHQPTPSVQASQRTICHLAGAPYYIGGKDREHMNIFKNNQLLAAVREPKNSYDSNAIGLYLNNKQIGHIPKLHNEKHAIHMDNGGKLYVKILRTDYDDPWKGVTLDISNA